MPTLPEQNKGPRLGSVRHATPVNILRPPGLLRTLLQRRLGDLLPHTKARVPHCSLPAPMVRLYEAVSPERRLIGGSARRMNRD
jgi:hypothetical protein